MSNAFEHNLKIGVLGGGQLGRMLIQSAVDFNITLSVLDPDPHAPCSGLSDFHCGSITDYDSVMAFGETCDLITIEIENVNTDALKSLARAGKTVYPQPEIIALIQDKRTQKQFFRDRTIPTADFILTEDREHVMSNVEFLPAVHKLGRAGYDGRGVQILRGRDDLDKSFDAPGVLEKLVDFTREISVIVARNPAGEMVSYPPVEMAFHAEQNLVEYLFSPARLSAVVREKADVIARRVARELDIVGLLAVEMFVTQEEDVLVNEIAPRPHNSGHHTIEANVTSQYEQLLRAILNLPAGDTSVVSPSAMVNLLGEPGYNGPARYMGFEEVMALPGAHIHLYGKRLTKPFRKMGHVTIVDSDEARLFEKVNFVKQKLKVIA
ncbi:MAG TPA: 5-(carboxyamino)imidazole ribonucleotide synthase [Cyclobacteriaceae bacterium]